MLPTTVLAGVLCLFGLRKRRRLQMLVWVVVSAVEQFAQLGARVIHA